ncbi:diguanylate cyclase [Sphaerisporangium krabiense]|uniref:Peptide/nickel transport system permease protein n=1 Tax=Sphaerisporangium krabiense TaxID=763782 RepID=A0A7W9DQJ1_9ACTN|nr:ABC transporter permease [Sphaerisporangium krabiense]MBB5627592.1 peptide/nickel transport system permease protein [Sphaerisporangium krabiense]GII66606.1 diguanylate cyclase [Sphaerisporangium krabiense]
MLGYLVRRIGQAVFVVLVVTVVVFVLLHQLPGGPARAIIGAKATADQIREFNKANGLDAPAVVQYFRMLRNWASGDFGFSYKLNQSVGALIADRLPKTLVLNLLALALTVAISVPVGIYQAVRRGRTFDYAATWAAFVFYAAPSFFLGIVLISLFSQQLEVFPPQAPQTDSVAGLFADFRSMILPIIVLSLSGIAIGARYMRSSVLDNIGQEYVRTAQAKGCSGLRVMTRHVLRNAIIPIVTLLGLSLPALFAGALIAESLFNFPGMGLLFWQAAQASDYPIELAVVLVTAVATVAGNLVADICYAVLDPRVRLAG